MKKTENTASGKQTTEQPGAGNRKVDALVRRSVQNPRYTLCCSAKLEDLDFERGWWTDTSGGCHYLHVWHKDGETAHRVYCRGCDCPRLEWWRGKLMWLFTLNTD